MSCETVSLLLDERLTLTVRNIGAVAAWNSALEESLFVFVKDVSKCAIARKTVKKRTGQNPIAMNSSNCKGSLEVGLCLKVHWALVAEQTLVFLSITRALHSTASLGARFYTKGVTFCPAHENQAMCMWPCVVAKLNIQICP